MFHTYVVYKKNFELIFKITQTSTIRRHTILLSQWSLEIHTLSRRIEKVHSAWTSHTKVTYDQSLVSWPQHLGIKWFWHFDALRHWLLACSLLDLTSSIWDYFGLSGLRPGPLCLHEAIKPIAAFRSSSAIILTSVDQVTFCFDRGMGTHARYSVERSTSWRYKYKYRPLCVKLFNLSFTSLLSPLDSLIHFIYT